jgi:hypothetical protein
MSNLIPTLKSWVQELWELRALKKGICNELEISTMAYRDEIMSKLPRHGSMSPNTGHHPDSETLHHIQNLFGVDGDITETMNQIFLFVSEVRNFLNFARKVIGLPSESSLSAILLQIKQNLIK